MGVLRLEVANIAMCHSILPQSPHTIKLIAHHCSDLSYKKLSPSELTTIGHRRDRSVVHESCKKSFPWAKWELTSTHDHLWLHATADCKSLPMRMELRFDTQSLQEPAIAVIQGVCMTLGPAGKAIVCRPAGLSCVLVEPLQELQHLI